MTQHRTVGASAPHVQQLRQQSRTAQDHARVLQERLRELVERSEQRCDQSRVALATARRTRP